MGEVQLSIADRKSQLEVEVIRARALNAKPGAKVLPGQLRAPRTDTRTLIVLKLKAENNVYI